MSPTLKITNYAVITDRAPTVSPKGWWRHLAREVITNYAVITDRAPTVSPKGWWRLLAREVTTN
jgi:hypothetical protein